MKDSAPRGWAAVVDPPSEDELDSRIATWTEDEFRDLWYDEKTGEDDHGRGPSAAKSAALHRAKVDRARRSHVPITREKLAQATSHEQKVAQALGAEHIGGTKPIDVVIKNSRGQITHAIEVKAIFGKHDKITMHPTSRERKEQFAGKHGAEAHTVAIDARGNKPVYYHRSGYGSYRLHGMTRVKNLAHLKQIVRPR